MYIYILISCNHLSQYFESCYTKFKISKMFFKAKSIYCINTFYLKAKDTVYKAQLNPHVLTSCLHTLYALILLPLFFASTESYSN